MKATSTKTVMAGCSHQRSVRSERAAMRARPGAPVPAGAGAVVVMRCEIRSSAGGGEAVTSRRGSARRAQPLVLGVHPEVVGVLAVVDDLERRGRRRRRRAAEQVEVVG